MEMPPHDSLRNDTTMHMEMGMPMSHAYSLHLPMSRNGSGTSWLADNSPMYGWMIHGKKWMYMVHGSLFLRYTHHDVTNEGTRGSEKWDAPNWAMLMGQRMIGENGLFHFNVMMSLDPLTEGGAGYPLLFQTGESWNGTPLVDHQHPHDLFSELSVSYSYALSEKADVFVYAGYPGEPALGSVAFMHRVSALTNPDAPIGHHWNDATHITFGVATLGIRYGMFKLEGSSFTGREPNENRYDFDTPRFDSWSARLSFSPSAAWTLQASHGFIHSPEALHPEENISRTTASANYSHSFSEESSVDLTALWGVNAIAGQDAEHSLLAEGSVSEFRWNIYFRYEWLMKSGEELVLPEPEFSHDALYSMGAGTIGISYDVLHDMLLNVALGGQVSLYQPDIALRPLYGEHPVAAEVYLRIYPPRVMRMDR